MILFQSQEDQKMKRQAEESQKKRDVNKIKK